MRPRPSRRSNLSSVKVAGDLAKEVNYNSSSIVASKEGSASSFTQLLLPYILPTLLGRLTSSKLANSLGYDALYMTVSFRRALPPLVCPAEILQLGIHSGCPHGRGGRKSTPILGNSDSEQRVHQSSHDPI